MLKKQFAFLQRGKFIVFLLLFLSASNFSFAQEKLTVSGTVTSDSSMPLSSVSISIKGQSGGTTTDARGAFTIRVDKGATLIFSIVGYEDRQVKIDNPTTDLSVTRLKILRLKRRSSHRLRHPKDKRRNLRD